MQVPSSKLRSFTDVTESNMVICFDIKKNYKICGAIINVLCVSNPGEGHSTFFQVGVCDPDFGSVGFVN